MWLTMKTSNLKHCLEFSKNNICNNCKYNIDLLTTNTCHINVRIRALKKYISYHIPITLFKYNRIVFNKSLFEVYCHSSLNRNQYMGSI